MFFESDDLKIFQREWLVDNPKASVVVVHGLGEHCGRYEHVAVALNEAGYSVFGLDHRGHGQSEGKKGHINSFVEYQKDVKHLVNLAKVKYPEKDVHLLGHSMGAFISTGYALRNNDIKSIVITAPPYGVPGRAANLQLKIGAFAGKLLPNIGLSNQINPSDVCKNPEVVQKYMEDNLVHGLITLGWGTAFVAEQKYIQYNLSKLEMPYLLMVADEDKLTDAEVAKTWFETVGSIKKELVVYPNAYHEILNEVEEGKDALSRIVSWLARLG